MVEPSFEPTKKCPYCYARILADSKKCVECDKKVGPPDRFGMAQKPVDWMGYLAAGVALGGLGYFAYWLFVVKG